MINCEQKSEEERFSQRKIFLYKNEEPLIG